MATAPAAEATADRAVRRWWRWLWLPVLLLLLLGAAVPAGLWYLSETASGRAFVVRQLSGVTLESGLNFRVARIDGSLLSRFTLVDVTVVDLSGTLATLPVVAVDWEPITLLSRRISVNRLTIPSARVLRMWNMHPRNPNTPLLPDIDIRIDRFQLPSVVLEKPVFGRREEVAAIGRVDIHAGRLLLETQATAKAGDRLLLLVDAEPDRNHFNLSADLRSPKDGMLPAMAGLRVPLALKLSGAGNWATWRGRLDAGIDAVPIVDVAISADNGRFRVTGDLTPASLLGEAFAPLVSPAVALDLTAEREDDHISLRFVASSATFAMSGSGGLDIKDNILSKTRADLMVKQPQHLNPALSADNLRATLILDGPLAQPAIGWSVAADRIGWSGDNGPMGATRLAAQGSVRLPAGAAPLTIAFDARMASSFGLPPETAALLQDARLLGTISFSNGTTTASGLRLTTSQLSGTGNALVRADGSLSANVAGQVPRIAFDGLGTLSVSADARIIRRAGGNMAVDGSFDGRALTLASAGAADFLGGLPSLRGDFRLAAAGDIAVSNARFDSPNLSFAKASARYSPASGQFALDAAGTSRAYGPLFITASGSSRAPKAIIRLPKPGFGVGMTDLVANISPADGGIALSVTGDSPQGDLEGHGTLLFGDNQPLVADIALVRFAAIQASGRLVQTPAGPFAGRLTVDGQGLEGSVVLADRAGLQQVDVKAIARGARLPLDPPVLVGSGTVDMRFVLGGETPQMAGTFNLAGVRREALALTNIAGRFTMAGDQASGRMTVAGRYGDGQPFRGTAALQTIAGGYAVRADGMLGRTPVKLEQAAQILRLDKGGWALKPVRIVLPAGRLVLAGQYADPLILRLVLEDVDLSVANNFVKGLGLTGTAAGQVNIRWDKGYPVPLGAANIEVKKLSRAGIGGVTIPVDMKLSARSNNEDGLLLGGTLSWQGNQLGRLLLKLVPGEGEDATSRLLNGQLSGGVRYNGPVEPIWAMSGLEGQELRGPVAVAADVRGTVSAPVLNGVARGRGLLYRNVLFGTEIDKISFDGSFDGPLLKLTRLEGRAGQGMISGSGTLNLAADARSIQLNAQLTRARVADSDIAAVTLTGPLALTGTIQAARLTGDLRVDDARIQVVQVETSEIPTLRVRRAGEVRVPDPEPTLSARALALDVRVRADDRVRVEGMGLDSMWRGDMQVRGTAAAPQLVGTATLASGDFSFAGSSFDLTSGRVVFNGAPMDSSINIQAQTVTNDVTAFVTIGGTAARPEIQFSSTPSLPEDEILARLLFGSSVAELSVTEAVQLATAIAGLQSGTDTMGKIRRSVGVDRLRLVSEDSLTGMGTGLAVGKRLTRNVYVEVISDSQGNTLATVQWSLSRTLSLLMEISSLGNNSANMRYQRDY